MFAGKYTPRLTAWMSVYPGCQNFGRAADRFLCLPPLRFSSIMRAVGTSAVEGL
jgi:hypothetical protein